MPAARAPRRGRRSSCTSASPRPARPSCSRSCGATGPSSRRAASCCRAITRKTTSGPARTCAESRSWPATRRGRGPASGRSWPARRSRRARSRSSRTSCSRPPMRSRPTARSDRCCPPRCTSCSPCATSRRCCRPSGRRPSSTATPAAWEDWLGDVIDRESVDADRRQWWFWRVHDTLAILDIWSRHAARRSTCTSSPPRRPDRPAGCCGSASRPCSAIDPGGVDLTRARPNASLGMPEIEFLRRLNQALPDEVPDWFYMWNVKEAVAHQALADRPREGRLVLPASRDAWAKGQGGGARRRPGRLRVRPHRRSGRAPPAARHRALRRPGRPAGRAGARRRRDGGGGAGGQPVPQGVPGGQAAAGPRPAARAGPAGSSRPSPPRRGSSGPCASSAAARRPSAGCASWRGGRSSASGRAAGRSTLHRASRGTRNRAGPPEPPELPSVRAGDGATRSGAIRRPWPRSWSPATGGSCCSRRSPRCTRRAGRRTS